jgi:hypothetical protein
MKRALSARGGHIALLTLLSVFFMAFTEGALAAEAEATHQDEAEELAKKVQNPLANLVTVPLQFNYNRGVDTGPIAGGDLEGGSTFFNLNVQPVVPFPGEKWNIISRTIIPINSVPLDGIESVFGLGDISFSLFWSPAKPVKGITWGVGPAFILPTASNPEVLGSEKWSVGPTAVIFYGVKNWTVGAVASNVWSVAGNDDRQDVNFFSAQPFVNYNFGKGLALGTAPIITCDWKRESGDECTIPVGLQISKVLHLGQRPANLLFGYYKNASHPDKGAEEQVRFQINFMFPQKK